MELAAAELIRVQTLVENHQKPQVPPQYIQPPANRPTKLATPPVIGDDLVPVVVLASGRDVHDLRRDITEACSDWGVFHVTNHGVPIELLDDVRRVGLSFFEDFPASEKLRYACDSKSPAAEGYGSRMLVESNENVLDWRDYFDHHALPLSRRNPSRWPHYPLNYREVLMKYSDHMSALARKLLALISESLDLQSSFFEEAVGEFYQNITISYYPPCPQPELTLGLQPHSDMGVITLLIQDDVGGLQVLKDGEWVTVQPRSHAILVILSDQTEIITNGTYRSATHRAVTNPNRARVSVATFHDPEKMTKISPAFKPPRYHEVLYGDYVSSWYTKGPDGRQNIDALKI